MTSFYLPKNKESRTPPDSRLVEWLMELGDGYHALIGVVGPDFKSDCIVVKPRGLFTIYADSTKYHVARKDGDWINASGKHVITPVPAIEDGTNKILDYIIQLRDKLFPENVVTAELLYKFSTLIQVFWLVALTHRYPKGTEPKVNGRIFCNEGQFQAYLRGLAWSKSVPRSMYFDDATASRLANLLGFESVSIKEIAVLREKGQPPIANPYYFVGAVEANNFRGRTDEISKAMSALSPERSTPVILVGLQRTGKSSLASEIIRRLTSYDKGLRAISYVFGNWDEKPEQADVAGFLLKNIPDKHNIENIIRMTSHVKKSTSLEREFLRDALRHLKKTTKQDTLIFLDEFHKLEEMTSWPGRSSFANFIESIAGDKGLGLKLLVTARPNILTKSESIKKVNLLKLFRPIPVASVDVDAAIQIVNLGRPELIFDEAAINRILILSGRNPYWIQLLCYFIFEHLTSSLEARRVSERMVNRVFFTILRHPSNASYFESSYQDIVEMESSMTVLDMAARLARQEGQGVLCAQLQSACNFSEQQFNYHLAPLLNYEVLAKNFEDDPATLVFGSEGLRLYLRQERNLALGQDH